MTKKTVTLAKAAAKTAKPDEIVRQAYQVFHKKGFHATAVDKVLADSGISKRTVYKYFRSKEDLIAAAIDHYRHATFEMLAKELEKRAASPRAKILALFDLRRDLIERGDYAGCFSMNARLEYDGKAAAVEAASTTYLRELESFIGTLCREARCKNPAATAKKIMILLQGAIVYGQSLRDARIPALAKDMAAALLPEK